ncbi:MAG: GNAT family N-acetyltransferase [Defluviitaleaceae bacterium]|nr:GNAT family N-acetyltransferase [Defluviitaleaceae bacterium]
MIDKIAPLEKEKWQDYRLEYRSISHSYYDVKITPAEGSYHVSFVKKPFDVPFENNDHDKLFQPWWDDIKAWGIVEEDKLLAAIETTVEDWNNRLRITELWVDHSYRRQGIAKALMDIALQRARDEGRRAVVLETQARNEAAVAFYIKYGFSLIGFDACAYHNDDLESKKVRMEFGILLDEVK